MFFLWKIWEFYTSFNSSLKIVPFVDRVVAAEFCSLSCLKKMRYEMCISAYSILLNFFLRFFFSWYSRNNCWS